MNRFKECRLRAGLSQKFVAATLKVASPSVSNWESGKTMPTPENLSMLASLYGVSVDYLLGRDEPPSQPAETPAALDRELKAAFDQLPDDASKQDVIDYILFRLGRSKK